MLPRRPLLLTPLRVFPDNTSRFLRSKYREFSSFGPVVWFYQRKIHSGTSENRMMLSWLPPRLSTMSSDDTISPVYFQSTILGSSGFLNFPSNFASFHRLSISVPFQCHLVSCRGSVFRYTFFLRFSSFIRNSFSNHAVLANSSKTNLRFWIEKNQI